MNVPFISLLLYFNPIANTVKRTLLNFRNFNFIPIQHATHALQSWEVRTVHQQITNEVKRYGFPLETLDRDLLIRN
jgi:hypothetical protein